MLRLDHVVLPMWDVEMFHLLVGGNALRIVNATPSDVLVVRAHRLGKRAAQAN